MSAREKLLRVLRGQEEECYCDNPHCTSPEVLVDAYAHELAEKQRAYFDQLGLSLPAIIEGAINRIDPEVSDGGRGGV